MEIRSQAPAGETRSVTCSRRHALALMLGAWHWLPRGLAAAEGGAAIRLAISESMVADVNMNDARAAMDIWVKRIAQDMNVAVEYNPKVFDTSQDILNRIRGGSVDAVALNVVEYRQVASLLDPSQVVTEAGPAGPEQYVILVKQSSGIQKLGDLKGRRLCTLKVSKMCVAADWLSTLLDQGHFGQSEQFFGAMTTDNKVARVVLPVFFGQMDACLTSKRSFDTMCTLNPQVARDLKVLAVSPPMVVTFYVFRKNYREVARERFMRGLMGLPATPAGRQLATLFQFGELTVRDASCLAPALTILDLAERVRGRQGAGGRKG